MKIYNIFLIVFLIFVISCAQQPEHIVEQAAPNQIKNVDILKNGDTSGIEAEAVNYGPAVGFLAQPRKEGKYPAVVMIHEWWGLNDNIKEMARSLAAEGYVVLAVDLYNGKVGKNSTEAGQLAGAVRSNTAAAVQNMKTAVEYALNHPEIGEDFKKYLQELVDNSQK